MKYYIYICSIAALLLMGACEDKEEELSPSNFIDQVAKFEFPEGDDPWDMRLLKLTETYDVIPIYKSFTAKDLNRRWTGFGETFYSHNKMDTICYTTGNKTVSKAEVYTDFLIDEVFTYYNPEIANQVLPMFFYFAEDIRQNQPSELVVPANINGFDYWYLTFHSNTPNLPHDLSYPEDLQYPSDLEVIKKWHQGETLNDDEQEVFRACRNTGVYMYIESAIEQGIIQAPAGFKDLVDYTTRTSSSSSNPNYFVSRGFVHQVRPRTIISVTENPWFPQFPTIYIEWHFRTLKSASNTTLVKDNNDLKYFVRIAMRFTQEEFEAEYPPAQYPLVNERYHMIVNHFKNAYNIDLQKIAGGIK